MKNIEEILAKFDENFVTKFPPDIEEFSCENNQSCFIEPKDIKDFIRTEFVAMFDEKDKKDSLYLEPLNFDFDEVGVVSSLYMFQKAINNIIEVLNSQISKNISKLKE